MNTIVSESIYLFEIILYFIAFYLLSNYKYSDKEDNKLSTKGMLIAVAYVLGMNTFQRVMQYISSNYLGEILIAAVMNLIVSFAITFIFFNANLKRRIWCYAIYYLPALVSEIFVLPIFMLILQGNSSYGITQMTDVYNNKSLMTICVVVEAQSIVCIWMALLLITKIVIDKVWPKTYMLFLIFPVYEALILFLFYQNVKELNDRVVVEGFLFVIFGFVIDFVLCYLIYKSLKERELAIKLDSIEREYQSEKVYNELVNGNLEQIRMLRHDFKNQLQVVYAGIDNGISKEEAREMLDEMNREMDKQSAKKYCENNIVNVILGLKERIARENDIDYRTKCAVPENIGISNIDICTLFNNVIDNAIEACQKIDNKEGRYIDLNCGIVNGYLTIKAINACAEKVDVNQNMIPSSKEDKKNHGMGIKRIKQVVNDHNGMLGLNCSDTEFEITIGLQVE